MPVNWTEPNIAKQSPTAFPGPCKHEAKKFAINILAKLAMPVFVSIIVLYCSRSHFKFMLGAVELTQHQALTAQVRASAGV